MTLTDVVRLLGDKNPRIAAEREAIASARADRRTAAAFPNPKLGFTDQEPSRQQTLFTGNRQEQVSVELPILIPGQRSSRVAKAEADISAAEARVAANIAVLRSEACISFVQLLALQQKSVVLSNALAEVTKLRDTISGRAAGGAASAYDLARIEVETGVLAARYDANQSELAAESSQLASALGLTNSLPIASGSLEPWEIPERLLYDPATQMTISPLALASIKEAEAAQAGIKAAQRARWPDLSLQAGRAWTSHPYGVADFIGLNVEIPIFDTRRGQLEKAKSDARAAEARRATSIAEAKATIHQLAEIVQRRQNSLNRYRTDVEPRLARLKEMSADAYLMGRHTVFELLDAEQARRDVILENIETLSSLIEAQIKLLTYTGQLTSTLEKMGHE